MIVKEGNKFIVKSENGDKKLSKPLSKEEAEKRLRVIHWFSNKSKKS